MIPLKVDDDDNDDNHRGGMMIPIPIPIPVDEPPFNPNKPKEPFMIATEAALAIRFVEIGKARHNKYFKMATNLNNKY